MKDGFLRVAAATPSIRVADCEYNTAQILHQIQQVPEHTALLVFPELCITGATCGELFLHPTLLNAGEQALASLMENTEHLDTVIVVGVPVATQQRIYNCAAVMRKGRLLGLVPKTHLCENEKRYFAPGETVTQYVTFAGQETLCSPTLLFTCTNLPDLRLGVAIGENICTIDPTSETLAKAGATVIAHLSAVPQTVGSDTYRKQWVTTQSAKLRAALVCANAGEGESTTDLVFAGGNYIGENSALLQSSLPYTTDVIATEIDLQLLVGERRKHPLPVYRTDIMENVFSLPIRELELTRYIPRSPFVPDDAEAQKARCEEILSIQTAGLVKRLSHTHSKAVLGLSGGLDSALALLVVARAYDRLGWDRADIHTVTMPCFGTTGRTLNNANLLAGALGTTLHTIPIANAVTGHLSDIGHDGVTPDVTFENAQARERTQVLMDLANRLNGLVIGTGDLSELALGWATFNGDHMSMYGVNAGVPKTMVRHLVDYEAQRLGGIVESALKDILDTPVSPELLPPQDGEIAQKTEQLVGPYALHDFILYYTVRYGFAPAKIYRLACFAFQNEFAADEIKKWLLNFYKRFFGAQFKRSCLPDGPKVGSISFSPRGDWQMPSDAVATVWLKEAENV